MAGEKGSEAWAGGRWYDEVRECTLRLVGIRSVSPSPGETQVAEEVVRLLGSDGLAPAYTEIGLDVIDGDLYGRKNAYAFVRGASSRTVVLLGHTDTVDTSDYGELGPWALDPVELAARQARLFAGSLRDAVAPDPLAGDWMFGRGTVDMKCGVAVNIAVMRHLARLAREGKLELSAVLLATADEERESAGVLQAVSLLTRLRSQYGLSYLGAINTDYTSALYPDDPHRYIYTGTVGKLLPSFLVVGKESHVGEPFEGVDANLLAAELIGDLSMNTELCDVVRGQITPPPVTLHAADLKARYDVQLPFAASFYLNVLTFSTDPDTLLERLCERAQAALGRTLARLENQERRWTAAQPKGTRGTTSSRGSGQVLTFAELQSEAERRLGAEQVSRELAAEWDRWPADLDRRERSLRLTYRLWTISGLIGPAVVLYFSPPYYPHVAALPCALHTAVGDVVAAHAELNLVVREYYPYLSDMSYLHLDAGIDTRALVANMPVWHKADAEPRPGAYSLPLDAIRALDLPVVNLGPYGAGAHQRSERLLMSYSFETVPQLVLETIERLAAVEA